MKNKPLITALSLVACVAVCAFCISGFIDMMHQTHTRGVASHFNAAVTQLEKSPPGVERAEKFVQDLKRIDPGYAPEEVKVALKAYIDGLEQGLVELRAGRDPKQFDGKIEVARTRLIQSVKKFE
jgi:hypothetical protein